MRPSGARSTPASLDPRGEAPALRLDPLLDEWVSVAAARLDRTFLPSAVDCPLCPSREGNLTEVPSDDYDVVVFENRFPSFTGLPTEWGSTGVFQEHSAWGRCEVVCFTPDHDSSFAALSVERARLVVEAWADRVTELSATPGVEQVFVFENRGEAIGVTMHHPHGQIYAYPYVTPRTRVQLDSVRRHHERTGRNLYDDVVAAELADGRRVVLESEHWVAFVPFAARWPVEVHLYPRRRVPDLAALSTEPSATTSPASTSTSCAAATRSSGSRCRTSRHGTRPPFTSTASSVPCTSSCSPCSAASTS